MNKQLPLTDSDGEVRELSVKDLLQFRPASEVISPDLLKGLVSLGKQRGMRGPQKSPVKDRVTIRLSHEVVEQFRATGEGWQTRVDAALKDWLKTHSPM